MTKIESGNQTYNRNWGITCKNSSSCVKLISSPNVLKLPPYWHIGNFFSKSILLCILKKFCRECERKKINYLVFPFRLKLFKIKRSLRNDISANSTKIFDKNCRLWFINILLYQFSWILLLSWSLNWNVHWGAININNLYIL